MSEKKHHWVMYSIFVVLVIIIVGGYFAYRMYFPKEQIVSSGQQWTPIEVTAENLPSVIESTPVVKDLPDEGVIGLKVGSASYVIEKDSVVPGEASNADVTITLPERYFEIIGNVGLCNALRQASSNNELDISFEGSTTSLAWKYRALAKYKSCIA